MRKRANMRRLRLLLVMMVIGGAIVGGAQILSASATGPPAAEPFARVVIPSGPELPLEKIEGIAQAHSEQAGEPTPTMSVGKGTLEDAMRSIDPSTSFPETSSGIRTMLSEPVVLVVMHGSFTLNDAHVRKGDPAPTGSVLDLVIDSHNGAVVGRALPIQQEAGGMPLASVASVGAARTGVLAGHLSVGGGPLCCRARGHTVMHGAGVLITGRRFLRRIAIVGNGTFRVRLRPGRYVLRGLIGGLCPPVGVVVRADRMTRAKLICSIR
jgi:hypothetical protein